MSARIRGWLSEQTSAAVMLFVLAVWGWLVVSRLQALFAR